MNHGTWIENNKQYLDESSLENFFKDEMIEMDYYLKFGSVMWADIILYLDNPCEEIKLEAVTQNGEAIQYIDNPSEKVQLAAVKEDGYAIEYIENPSEKAQLAAVTQNR